MRVNLNIVFNIFDKILTSRRADMKKHYKRLFQGDLVDHHHFDKAFQVYRFV